MCKSDSFSGCLKSKYFLLLGVVFWSLFLLYNTCLILSSIVFDCSLLLTFLSGPSNDLNMSIESESDSDFLFAYVSEVSNLGISCSFFISDLSSILKILVLIVCSGSVVCLSLL